MRASPIKIHLDMLCEYHVGTESCAHRGGSIMVTAQIAILQKMLWLEVSRNSSDPAITAAHYIGNVERVGGCLRILRVDRAKNYNASCNSSFVEMTMMLLQMRKVSCLLEGLPQYWMNTLHLKVQPEMVISHDLDWTEICCSSVLCNRFK